MGTLAFYRKLDLLNRIYILNYCKLDLLERPAIFKLPDALEDFLPKASEYLNFNDITLLVAVLPHKKIKFLIDKIILDLIKKDAQIALNSKALREIKNYFSPKDMNLLLSSPIKSEEYSFFVDEVMKHGIQTIFYHFLKIVFAELEKKLNVAIIDRFVPTYKFNDPLLKQLQSLPHYDLLNNTVGYYMPSLKSLFASHVI